MDAGTRACHNKGQVGVRYSPNPLSPASKDALFLTHPTEASKVETSTRQQATRSASKQAAQKATTRTSATTRQQAIAGSKQAAGNTAKGTIKQGSKGTIKTTAKSIKTAGTTAGKAVKTTKQTAQAGKVATKATQVAARSAAQAARAATRAAVAATKAAVKAVIAFVKMAIAAVQSLVSAIAAGGGVAIAVILIICLVALIVASAFGIFFAGGDMGDGNPSLREVVSEINQERQTKIDKIKADNPHDDLMISGTSASWPEVLAVYAVKTTTDSDDPLDAVTLDAQRQKMLKDIYRDMNTIDYDVGDRQYTEVVTVKQNDGSVTEQTQTSTRRTLYITQVGKTADQMAETYGFSDKQRQLLAEMLTPQYASAWKSVLYGTRSGSGDIVEVAASQLGNPGGQPYWSWYGFNSRVAWCACFVSWCANQCGYIEAGVVPKFSYVQTGIDWFKDAGCWQDGRSGYKPQPGDIIFFDWGDGGDADHVGIVESCDGVTIHTIEGNSSDAVNRRSYNINSSYIIGYGLINQ